MLLIFTNSVDGTSDEIVRRIRPDRVFRFNIDLWRDYEIRVDPTGFSLSDPAGRLCTSGDVRAAYLRKPTFDDLIDVPAGGCPEAWLRAQISYLTQELFNWCRDAGLVRLVEKGAQQRFGKFCQMWLARKYFLVPAWLFVKTNGQIAFAEKAISKPLVPDFVCEHRMFYTTRVSSEMLDRTYPWLLQEEVHADADVTVVYVAGRCFCFSLDRSSFDGVDWRRQINKQELNWRRWSCEPAIERSICNFMQEAGLEFGRLDFLLEGRCLRFLEVNPNGQWAWLDLDGTHGVFDAVVNELSRDWI
jgi:hypothetical protein